MDDENHTGLLFTPWFLHRVSKTDCTFWFEGQQMTKCGLEMSIHWYVNARENIIFRRVKFRPSCVYSWSFFYIGRDRSVIDFFKCIILMFTFLLYELLRWNNISKDKLKEKFLRFIYIQSTPVVYLHSNKV